MRRALLALACAFGFAGTASAAEPAAAAIPFARIQETCVQTEALKFGPGERWTSCRLTRAGFVGTIGLLDYYYAAWCLVARGERCDRVALVVFANRAYREEATLQFHRVDPAGTRYEHAMMIGGESSHAIATSARAPKGGVERQYHAWTGSRWQAVDGAEWRAALAQELQAKLPADLRAQLPGEALPDPERMAIAVPLRRVRDGAPAGIAEVAVRVEGARLAVSGIDLGKAAR